MLRVVVDTSTLVSYVLTRSTLLSRLIDSWRAGAFVLVTSPDTIAELTGVLNQPRIKDRAAVSLAEMAAGVERYSETVTGLVNASGACRDPKDDKFLACASEGRADYLISSDADLLDMQWYLETAIVNPGQFLLILEMSALEADAISARYQRSVLERVLAGVSLQPDLARRIEKAMSMLAETSDTAF